MNAERRHLQHSQSAPWQAQASEWRLDSNPAIGQALGVGVAFTLASFIPVLPSSAQTAVEAVGAVGAVEVSEAHVLAQDIAQNVAQDVEVQDFQAQDSDPAPATPLSNTQAGYDFLEKGWVNDAIQSFQAALIEDSVDLEAKLGLAIAYQRAGEDEKAWNAYRAVVEQDATELTALRAVGTLGSYRPEWQSQGIEALDALLQLQPEEIEARAQRALLLGYQQRFDEAIADYEILLAPDSALPPGLEPQVWVNAAQIYTYSDRTDQALPLFRRYLNQGGVLEQPAQFAYATALRKQGQTLEAIAVLDAIRPQNSDEAFERLLNLALAHQDNNDPEEALFLLKPTLNPLPEDLGRRRAIANALLPIQSPPPALLPTYQELLLDPEPVTFLHFRAGQIQLQTGDLVGARESLQAYQDSTPELDLGTEFLLAQIDQREGLLEVSGDRYASLLELTEGEQQIDALRGIAAIRFEQQRLIEAEGLYRQLIARRPDDFDVRRVFAELLLAKDQPKEALSQFGSAQEALATTPEIAEVEAEEQAIAITQRQRSVRRGFLRRRGFQPRWERF